MRNETDEDLQAIFLNLVDRFTTWHLRILRLLDDPVGGAESTDYAISEDSNLSAAALLERVYPEIRGREEFYNLLGNELSAAGLARIGTFESSMWAGGVVQVRSTNLGRQFLRFITEPSATQAVTQTAHPAV
jgi:hypothetical protein